MGLILMFYIYYVCFLLLPLKCCVGLWYMGQEYWCLKAWFVVCENYMFSVLGCLLHWYMV